MGLDRALCDDRQPLADASASLCVYDRRSATLADDLLRGTVVLPPHPPVQIPVEPSWNENPLGEPNWEFQFHSLRWLRPLKLAWDLRADDKYLDRYIELLHSWWVNNPRSEPPSSFSWEHHATAHRAMVYGCATQAIPSEQWLAEATEQHGAVLAEREFYARDGNHALNQNLGLLACGYTTGNSAWTELARRRIDQLLCRSVSESGATNEQAISYQLYNFRAYEQGRSYLEACGVQVPASFARVDRMPELLAHATLPNGEYETLGDTSFGLARPIEGTVAEFAATRGETGPQPARSTVIYPQAGFAFGRTGWGNRRAYEDEIFYSIRFGAPRKFHGHRDGGSVTLYGFGRRLILDPGWHGHSWTPIRAHLVSREAHNLVVTDRKERRRAPANLIEYRNGPDEVLIRIRQKPYVGVGVERSVMFSRGGGFLLIDDRVSAKKESSIRQLWHLDRGACPESRGISIVSQWQRGNIMICQLADEPEFEIISGRTEPMQGWVSYNYGEAVPAPTVEFVTQGCSARFLTLLIPFAERPPDLSVGTITAQTGGYYKVPIEIDGSSHELSC